MDRLVPDSLLDALLVRTDPQGAKSWLTSSGKVRLMFLKHYTGLSDELLVERLNTDWSFQLFCHLDLSDGEFIRDKTLVTRVRMELSSRHWGDYQRIFQKYWKGELTIEELKVILMDTTRNGIDAMRATSATPQIRTADAVKLLWESCEWLHQSTVGLCKSLSIARPGNKYLQQEQKYDSYSRSKKKTYSQTKQRKRSLLYLLEKLIGQIQAIFDKYAIRWMGKDFYDRLKIIKTVLQQQRYLFDKPDSSLPDRIVSLAKPFIRPIVRGKELKRDWASPWSLVQKFT
jgi:transposase, IS5 family